MVDRVHDWLGRTPRQRAINVAALLFGALVLFWAGRDDPLPFLLLWLGFALAIAGVHALFPASGGEPSRRGGLLAVVGFATCAAAESLDGDQSWFGFMLVAFVVLGVAKRRRDAMAAATGRG